MQYIILLRLHNSIPHTKWLKQQQLFSCSSRGWIFEIKTAPPFGYSGSSSRPADCPLVSVLSMCTQSGEVGERARLSAISCVHVRAQACLILCNPMGCSPPGSSAHGILSLDKNTGVGCQFLLQSIFLTQGWNPGLLHLLHWQAESLPLELPGKPPCFLLKGR